MGWLSRLFGFSRRTSGYVYVADGEDGAMAHAAVGASVRNPAREAPWIVAHHTLGHVTVARWPGRLWRVEIVDAISSNDMLADAGYTRAAAVTVLEELPAHIVFGAHGAALVPVFDAARALTREQAARLAAALDDDATTAAKNRLWQRWLEETDPQSPHRGQDLGSVLAVVGRTPRSPAGSGLTVLHQLVFQRATDIDGDKATEEDDEDVFLLPPWSDAVSALCDAALAFGAPHFTSDEDRALLLQAWHAVFGAR